MHAVVLMALLFLVNYSVCHYIAKRKLRRINKYWKFFLPFQNFSATFLCVVALPITLM